MPPKTPYPTPALRLHNGAWKIIWNYNGRQYSVSTGLRQGDKIFAEKWRVDFAIALKQDSPSFPEKFAESQAVGKYIAARYGMAVATTSPTGNWLADYESEIKGECSKRWAQMSIMRLKELENISKGLPAITPESASKLLMEMTKGRKPGTRNRYLSNFSRFYKWAVRTRRARQNPFAGIRMVTEERHADIVHCTPTERDEILTMARESAWVDWLAIPVAFYTGMRREEMSRLDWDDVRFSKGLVVVQKSKTGKSRVVPLSSALEKILLEVPEERRSGPVVITPSGIDRLLRLDNLVRHLRRMKRDRLLASWSLERPLPSRAKEYRQRLAEWKNAIKKKEKEFDAALERIGWNSFRHTFGSLLAQAGVSLDKISAWMGNTPEVCRRHYAQFIPRDRRDSEIDKL